MSANIKAEAAKTRNRKQKEKERRIAMLENLSMDADITQTEAALLTTGNRTSFGRFEKEGMPLTKEGAMKAYRLPALIRGRFEKIKRDNPALYEAIPLSDLILRNGDDKSESLLKSRFVRQAYWRGEIDKINTVSIAKLIGYDLDSLNI